jgi:hypothetical protein
MSMIGNFLKLSPEELAELIADPSAVEEFIYPEDESRDDAIDVDKAWPGIHFLLAGDAGGGDPPLANVLLGGTEVGDDIGYGPASYLTADEVKAVANALDEIPPEAFATRYDATSLTQHGIYPEIRDESDAAEYLSGFYKKLRDYYRDAASHGQAMLR